MKFIFIYDNTELQEIGPINSTIPQDKQVSVLTVENGMKKGLYDVAADIKEKTFGPEPCIIVLDQYLDCADEGFEWLQRSAGVALIKFLRMLDVFHHILLLTPFTPFQLIQQSPGNLILSLKGISFSKCLGEFETKSFEELEGLAASRFDNEANIGASILAEFQLPENERHNWANWWGIKRLIDVHRSLFPDELETARFRSLDEEMKSLRNIQARCLFRHDVDFNHAAGQVIQSDNFKKANWLKNEIARLVKKIDGTGRARQNSEHWADYLLGLENNLNRYGKEYEEIYIQKVAETKQKIADGKRSLIEHRVSLAGLTGNSFDYPQEFIEQILSLRFKNKSDKPKIVYIDDMAEKGWSEIFQIMIYGNSQDSGCFHVISHSHANVEELYEQVRATIENKDPDLILLDLRLYAETGTYLQVEELSGSIILQSIRRDFPGLPVMMTSASNKMWSRQALLNLGADSYWMKEGLDITSSLPQPERERYSAENYRSFLKSIHVLCSSEYAVLKTLGKLQKKMRDGERFWWEFGKWQHKFSEGGSEQKAKLLQHLKNGPQTADTGGIQMIIEETYYLLFSYLQVSTLDNGFYDEGLKWFHPSLVIQQLGKVLELIHGIDHLIKTASIGLTIHRNSIFTMRGDTTGLKLYKVRHQASHYGEAQKLGPINMNTFVKAIVKYLSEKPKYRT